MYSNYKVQSSRNTYVLLLIIKLLASVCILYSACLIIPLAMQSMEQTRERSESLKVRVIANSSLAHDQQMKLRVVEEIQTIVANNVQRELNEGFFREVIHIVQKKFPKEEISLKVGDNLLPPTYQYPHFYPQNNAQSVVFKIGAGRGENWFCAAFSAICRGSEQPKAESLSWKMEQWLARKNIE